MGTLAVLVWVGLGTLAAQPASEVRGTGVADGDGGRPLAGVSVKLCGSAVSTTTNAKGAYAIRVPSAAAVLEFSREGYQARKRAAEGRAQVDVALKPAARTSGVVKGIVTDSDNGNPIAGITVVLWGSCRGATTDAKGAWSLAVPCRRIGHRLLLPGLCAARKSGWATARRWTSR
ncbi:MAG: carboxypeptidase regulatory-like domain-containing protein [Alistipes senegalensis]